MNEAEGDIEAAALSEVNTDDDVDGAGDGDREEEDDADNDGEDEDCDAPRVAPGLLLCCSIAVSDSQPLDLSSDEISSRIIESGTRFPACMAASALRPEDSDQC